MKCDHTLHLSDICDYVKDKIAITALNRNNYVSTENMLANKAGIVRASSLPAVAQTQAFLSGDVLVSNIRPYFKKIWFAKFDGGCSNDVLVFRAKEGVSSRFLYYVLANDSFFAYSTATSKGTKMPRGDKTAIMGYEVPKITPEEQEKITAILSALDDKIELNNKINANLEQQAQALFKAWFVDFEPFGGKMPEDWRRGRLSEIASISAGKRPPMRQELPTSEVNIPLIGAASIMGYTNTVLYNEPILVTGRVGTHGVVQRFRTSCWASDNTLVIKSKFYEYVYLALQRVDYSNMNRGTTQPLITQTDLKNVQIVIPSEAVMSQFEENAGVLMALCSANCSVNAKLGQIRDGLLPKLMSGKVFV